MPFPFSIRYSARLADKYARIKNREALELIAAFIEEKTGDDIVIEDEKLTFKSHFFKLRMSTNILAVIDRGAFHISEKGDKRILRYEFYLYRLFIIAGIMSLFAASLSRDMWFGIFCFLMLGCANWVIAIVRHRLLLNHIAKHIDRLVDRPQDAWQAATGPYPFNILTRKTTDGKTLEIHTILDAGYTVDDRVFINGSPAPNGKYKLGEMEYLSIEDGKINSL